jgi:CheY-like chemotaxis protein
MPEMDGLTLAAELRRRRPQLPLVLLSSLEGYSTRGQPDTFVASLAKPIKASQLYETLVEALGPSLGHVLVGRPPALPVAPPASKALRVLLAEDNLVNQKVALLMLEQLGYRADVASNGLEALTALRRQPYEVILLDVQMPELDGLETARRICAEWPRERRPRLIAMTANAMQGDREACLAAGMDDYISKPVRIDDLQRAFSQQPSGPATPEAAPKPAPIEEGLDGKVLQDLELALGEGGAQDVADLIVVFLRNTTSVLEAMEVAAARRDGESLLHAAHSLKSTSASLGAWRLSLACRDLETRLRTGLSTDDRQLLAFVARIQNEFAQIQPSLASWHGSGAV